MFELRRDPVTGWWSAIVTDRSFEHSSFAVQALPVEGTHCRHCDEAPDGDDDRIRRVTLRQDAFHRIDSTKESASQLSISEVSASSGSWEILVGPAEHHERLADARPQLAVNLLRAARDTMRQLAEEPREEGMQLYVQAVQSYGRQAGSRSQHLNMELYAIPQIPHWVAEEIGCGARHMISNASDFTTLDDDALEACRATLQRALGALNALGDPPYNLFLHTAPSGQRIEQTYHWHWELHPRLRVIAGLERATALAVNPAAPEYAAELLRSQPHP